MARKVELANARKKFSRHKAQSKFRNIGFHFTFEQWYDWWLSHGIDKETDDFSKSDINRPCMCRYNDTGDYEPNNVYLTSQVQNVHDAKIAKVHLKAKRQLNYRWGADLININQLREKLSGKQFYPAHFHKDNYDKARQTESRQLTNRFREEFGSKRKRTEFHCSRTDTWHKTLKDVAKSMQMDPSTYKRRHRLGHEGYESRLTHTLAAYILKHTRYPDPIIPEDY